MKYRILILAAAMLTACTGVYAQASLTGKWQTEAPAPGAEQANSAPGQKATRRAARQIILDLQADSTGKISGSVTEVGNPPVQVIDKGQVTGKTITLVTQPQNVTWHLQVVDDNTLTLTDRVFSRSGDGEDGAPKGETTKVRRPQNPVVFHRLK